MQESLEDYLKFTRNSKQDESLKISKEMVVTAQIKKECDVRAMKIIEFSIEGRLRPEVFTRCLPFINQAHYQDIVEERAITKLCGYSLCGKRIPDMPKKQYFISTKSNKVYDITERKNFCSNFCYKASLHIKKQIDNSPLWLRKLECIPEYKLLHPSEGGLPGEFIDQGVVKPVDDLKFTSINDFAQASLGDISERDVDPGKSKPKKTRGFKKPSRLKSTMQTISETEVEEEVAANETSKTVKKIDPKKSVKVVKKESHKKNCIVSLPSIEENEERLQSTKENDSGRELNVKIEGKVLDDAKLVLKEERLEESKINLSSQEEIQKTTESTTARSTKCEQIHDNSIQIKNEEISIKKEPPEKTPDKSSGVKSKKLIRKKQNSSPKVLDIESIVKKSIEDWVTLETCIFIHGEKKVKQVLSEKKLSDYFEALHVQELQREQQMRYIDICRRLQLQEMADAKFDKTMMGGNKLKPLPDYRILKEDTKDLKLKVKAFYEGSMYEEGDKNFSAKINSKQEEKEVEEGAPAVLPPVDVNSQNLLRRKIFLNSLSKAIQQLLQSLGASYTAVLSDLQALVKTFNLRADNITFKPLVWNYIALVLLDLLSLKDTSLSELLEERSSQEYIQILFEALPSKKNFVADVLSPVRNIELFVERFITRKDSNNM